MDCDPSSCQCSVQVSGPQPLHPAAAAGWLSPARCLAMITAHQPAHSPPDPTLFTAPCQLAPRACPHCRSRTFLLPLRRPASRPSVCPASSAGGGQPLIPGWEMARSGPAPHIFVKLMCPGFVTKELLCAERHTGSVTAVALSPAPARPPACAASPRPRASARPSARPPGRQSWGRSVPHCFGQC